MSAAEDFVAEHPRSILITHRKDGGLQASPVRVMVDAEGVLVATTRAATAKAKNLARDPRFTICSISDGWSGPWMTIEGTAACTGSRTHCRGCVPFTNSATARFPPMRSSARRWRGRAV